MSDACGSGVRQIDLRGLAGGETHHADLLRALEGDRLEHSADRPVVDDDQVFGAQPDLAATSLVFYMAVFRLAASSRTTLGSRLRRPGRRVISGSSQPCTPRK